MVIKSYSSTSFHTNTEYRNSKPVRNIAIPNPEIWNTGIPNQKSYEDLRGDKPPPAPDQDFVSNSTVFQERVFLKSICVHNALIEHVI